MSAAGCSSVVIIQPLQFLLIITELERGQPIQKNKASPWTVLKSWSTDNGGHAGTFLVVFPTIKWRACTRGYSRAFQVLRVRHLETGNSLIGSDDMKKNFLLRGKYFNCVSWGEGGMRRWGRHWRSIWRKETPVKISFIDMLSLLKCLRGSCTLGQGQALLWSGSSISPKEPSLVTLLCPSVVPRLAALVHSFEREIDRSVHLCFFC